MAKANRRASASSTPPSPASAEAAFSLWAKGDLRGARKLAASLLPTVSESEGAELSRLLADTAPDPRAMQVAAFALTVAALVVLLTKLFS